MRTIPTIMAAAAIAVSYTVLMAPTASAGPCSAPYPNGIGSQACTDCVQTHVNSGACGYFTNSVTPGAIDPVAQAPCLLPSAGGQNPSCVLPNPPAIDTETGQLCGEGTSNTCWLPAS
jgi:hypothetical protein